MITILYLTCDDGDLVIKNLRGIASGKVEEILGDVTAHLGIKVVISYQQSRIPYLKTTYITPATSIYLAYIPTDSSLPCVVHPNYNTFIDLYVHEKFPPYLPLYSHNTINATINVKSNH